MKTKTLAPASMKQLNGGKVISDTGAGTNPRVWTHDGGYEVVVVDGKAIWKPLDAYGALTVVALSLVTFHLNSFFNAP